MIKMDFIIKRMNKLIENVGSGSLQEFTLVRERIEYSLMFVLAYLWNQSFDNLEISDKSDIIEQLYNLQIGQIVGIIRNLDKSSKVLSKKAYQQINDYPRLRNQRVGHGFPHDDKSEEIVKDFIDLFDKLVSNASILSKNWILVFVKDYKNKVFSGERFDAIDGIPDNWSCSDKIFPFEIGRLYAVDGDMNYVKLSPFIVIENSGEDKAIFGNLKEKITGNVKYNYLFKTGNMEKSWEELASIYSAEDDNLKLSTNNTIMNSFVKNYDEYIDNGIGITSIQVKEFLLKNKSNVSATLWGHGGIGKTACAQKICLELFNDACSHFTYIIFISAKDRVYNVITGKIQQFNETDEQRIKTFDDVIYTIGKCVSRHLSDENYNIECICNEIIESESKMLFVIDDLETIERSQIPLFEEFINRLDSHYHKVLFTTRSKICIGQEIPLHEFDVSTSVSFVKSIIKNYYPKNLRQFENICKAKDFVKALHDATDGRPIFLFQFAHIFAQQGLSNDNWRELKRSESAKDFLYGRIYTYLSKQAQDLFCAVSRIISPEDVVFRKDVLFYIVRQFIEEKMVEQYFEELKLLKVVELYEGNTYRVYSSEILKIMSDAYEKREIAYKDTIRNNIRAIGDPSAITTSIYQARYEEANKLRHSGNRLEVEEAYRSILKTSEAPFEIRKRSLINMTNYISNEHLSHQSAIKAFEDFYGKFNNDSDVLKLYVQVLWTEGEKLKATNLLQQYVGKRDWKQNGNYEIYGLYVAYRSDYYLDKLINLESNISIKRYSDKGASREYEQIIGDIIAFYEKNNVCLFEFLKNKKLHDYQPKVRHNFEMAIAQSIKVALQLSKSSIKYCKIGLQMSEYAISELSSHYRSGIVRHRDIFRHALDNISNFDKLEDPRIAVGEMYDGVVMGVKHYGIFVQISKSISGLMHISNISDNYISCIYLNVHVGEIIKNVKLIDISVDDKYAFKGN